MSNEQKGEVSCIVERITVLEPKPGDVVLVSIRENATLAQIEEFCQVLAENLPSSIKDVQFIGARCFEGATVVRPEQQATRSEARMQGLREFAEQVARTVREEAAPKTLPTDVRRPESEGGWDGRQ